MNLIEIMGHVGSDPEERMTPSGRKVVSFRLADNMKSGEREETLWWRISCWGDQFDRMLTYVKKGSALIVHGEIRRTPETYQDREGQTKVSLEVTATQLRFSPFGGKGERTAGGEERPNYGGNQNQSGQSQGNARHSHQQEPSSTPGGFRPGAASDEFSEDNLPF